jgi:hypothetical protein
VGRASLIAALFLLCGCQRGCLQTWIRDRGAASKVATPLTMMKGIDCPDGLARCVGGAVEISHVARIPRPCPPSAKPEECQCPWEAADECPRGCAEEGTVVVTPPERAAARLCAPDPANPPARPVAGAVAPPGACEVEGYRCLGSLVIACAPGSPDRSAAESGALGTGPLLARPFAACVRGCVQEGEALGEEEADPEGAARILCAR